MAKKLEPLLQFSKDHDIITASFGGLTPILPSRVKDVPESIRLQLYAVLDELAKARGTQVTQNQILLKFLQKKGILAVTTSNKESRVKEYLEAESLPDLTDEEEQAILDASGTYHLRAAVSRIKFRLGCRGTKAAWRPLQRGWTKTGIRREET